MQTLKHMTLLLLLPLLLCLGAFALPETAAAEESAGWYWLSSDDKYSNYVDLSSITTTSSVTTDHGVVPTAIEAYVKTGYSYEGADETIRSYGIGSVIPNPNTLSYSVALLRVNPQNRTVQYVKEDFYDADGRVLWSHTNGREKEINSQSFEEQYYTEIIDHVFHQGESARRVAKDRWHDLYTHEQDGLTTTAIADTTTMRMKGENLIYWEWDTVKDATGNTLEIKFLKKAVNLMQGTERIVSARYWSGTTGWKDMEDDLDGSYRAIKAGTPESDGLRVLRAYARGFSTWVNRYSIN